MDNRDYQPSLLWAKTEAWYTSQRSDAQPYRPHELTLYVYRTDTRGAWMMNGPKLYWQETPMSGDYFTNCDQDALEKHSEKLGEVVLWDRRLRKTVLIGNTFAESIRVTHTGALAPLNRREGKHDNRN